MGGWPYVRMYEQSTGWPKINQTSCPDGEWKYVARWGKPRNVNWVRKCVSKL